MTMEFDKISLYPSQMDIVITERCNQNCDYCWVNKSASETLDFKSIKKAINIFLDFPIYEQTVTFTTTEPFIYPDLYKETIDYILLQTKIKRKKINIVTTTNGLNLNKKLRDFIIGKIDKYDNFRLNISLDGKQKSHDTHRRLCRTLDKSAFELSWSNFRVLPKDKVRVVLTVTPSESLLLRENINFIFKNGLRNIDIFPQVFTLWPTLKLKKLGKTLEALIRYLNKDLSCKYDLRILNRLWGHSHYAELLFGCDSKFYLFEWIQALPYSERKDYIIGDMLYGIDLKKRWLLFNRLFDECIDESNGICSKCGYKDFCGYPLPLFIWCRYYKNDFDKYLRNFCHVAMMFVDLSRTIKNEVRNELDIKRLS